jgi:hypothetical protein
MVVIAATNAYVQGDSSHDVTIRHGDNSEKESLSLLMTLYSPSTASGHRIPPPWSESKKLSPTHIELAGNLKVRFDSKSETQKSDGTTEICVSTTPTDEYADNPTARYQRLQQANEDTHNAHLKIVQKGSEPMPFDKLLEGISTNCNEVVKHELACKCILNLNTFGDSTFDIMGDCKLIMTEYSSETTKKRIIYLFQVHMILEYAFIFNSNIRLLHLFLFRQDLSSWSLLPART